MSTFFRGITETVPSLFRGIFSERNSVPNPSAFVPTVSGITAVAGFPAVSGVLVLRIF
jgi:hypothetical protein